MSKKCKNLKLISYKKTKIKIVSKNFGSGFDLGIKINLDDDLSKYVDGSEGCKKRKDIYKKYTLFYNLYRKNTLSDYLNNMKMYYKNYKKIKNFLDYDVFVDYNNCDFNKIKYPKFQNMEYIDTKDNSNIFSKLGIKIIKKINYNPNRNKYFVTSLFDGSFNKESRNSKKNIYHYILNLLQAIDLYKILKPNFHFRIYCDYTIIKSKKEIIINFLNQIIKNGVEIFIIEYNLKTYVNNNKKFFLATIFRHYSFMDPNIELCVVVDSDNFPTQQFIHRIVKVESEISQNSLIVFKPILYSRKNKYGQCVDQILAGMCGLRKQKGLIINPNLFIEMLILADKNYNTFQKEYIDTCNGDQKIKYSSVFDFGWEEQVLSNILIPQFYKKKELICFIPMIFDFGKGIGYIYLMIINCLSPVFKNYIINELYGGRSNFLINIIKTSYVDPLFGYNIYIPIILINTLHIIILKYLYTYSNHYISNIDDLMMFLSIAGYYNTYPSFNITRPIDYIFDSVTKLVYLKKLNGIKYYNIPKEAANEFNVNSKSYYGKVISEQDNETIILKNDILKILKNYKKPEILTRYMPQFPFNNFEVIDFKKKINISFYILIVFIILIIFLILFIIIKKYIKLNDQ